MKELVLHFGLSKTGTSTMQRSLFQNHSQIFFLGKYVPSQIPKGCASQQVLDCLNPLLWKLDAKIDVGKHRELYRNIISESTPAQRIAVASWEALGNASSEIFEKRLERVMAVCGNTRLLITLRNPLNWLPSLYVQNIQGQFIKRNQFLFGTRVFLDFETWMNRHVENSGSVANWLSYAENIKSAVAMLGKENVGVFLFEELRSNPDTFYTSIANFMKVDAEETLELAAGSHYNKRLLQGEMDYSQRLDSSLIRRMQWLVQDSGERWEKRRLAADSSESYNRPAKVKMSDEWAVRVAESTRKGHQWLANEFGLDLEKHNYPL